MSKKTIYRGSILDYVGDPSVDPSAVRFEADGFLAVEEGRICARGPYAALAGNAEQGSIVDLRDKLIVPGFIDAHVHYPQTAMIASYGEQLLAWLETYTFPAELAFSDLDHAERMARFFVRELLRNGTTTALVLCTVHPQSVEALASVALELDQRLILGKVLMDRNAPPKLCDTPARGYSESRELILRYHEKQRLQYAITPRFAPTSSPEQLKLAAQLHREFPTTYVHSHLAENQSEIDWVRSLFPQRSSYTDVYNHFGLVDRRSVFAHGIHLTEPEVQTLAEKGATIAFCPTSNLFLGSGLFSFSKLQAAGVNVALASDVGAGTSFSMLQTASEAYKVLQLQGELLSAHLGFFLMTLGGARALSLDRAVGNFDLGKEADFIVLDSQATPLLQLRSAQSKSLEERLFALMMLGDDRAVEAVYLAGRCLHRRQDEPF